jgi:DNA-binding response OmpR family regulator
MKVLLQDGNEAMRAAIRPMLAAHGVGLLEAGSPWEAAAVAARHEPDIVLLSAADVYSAGREVPALLAGRTRRIPTLLLGGTAGDARRFPVDGCLPYPFDAQRLLASISSVLGSIAAEYRLAEV